MTMNTLAFQPTSRTSPAKKQKPEVHPVPISHWFPQPVSVNEGPIQRKAACACGGDCPRCQNSLPIQTKLAVSEPGDPYEQEADLVAEQVMRMPAPTLQPPCASCSTTSTPCRGCGIGELVQRKTENFSEGTNSIRDNFVQSLGPGQPLDTATRAIVEPRFGRDFSNVRVHTDVGAARAAQQVNALAYTTGHDIVFGAGQYMPHTPDGRKLIAHELAHVVQQSRLETAHIQRTPASKVSCSGATPLRVPGAPPVDIADPVGVITAAENRANQMFDDVIDELDFTRQRIIGGEPVGWPTISDAIAQGLRLMGLDPDDRAVWTAPTGTGQRSVTLLLRRLRLIRSTIGAGSFFFFCLGTGRRSLGTCVPEAGQPDICGGAEAATCPGEFFTAFCPTFWTISAENQAAAIIHESSHNFATFIGHTGRFTNAECFARLVQVYADVPEALQRVDLCPNP